MARAMMREREILEGSNRGNLFADRRCGHVTARQKATLRLLGLPSATLSLFSDRETFPRAIFSAQACRKNRPGRVKPVRRQWRSGDCSAGRGPLATDARPNASQSRARPHCVPALKSSMYKADKMRACSSISRRARIHKAALMFQWLVGKSAS